MSAIDELTPVPDQPEISEGNKTFSQKTYALYVWIRKKLVPAMTELSALIINSVTGAFNATSATSMTLSPGEKTIMISTGRSYAPGTQVRIAYVVDPTVYIDAVTKAYNKTTGEFIFIGGTPVGSGTYDNWSITISASGANGATLASNKFNGQQVFANEITVASAATIDLTAADSNQVKLTGSASISAVTLAQGAIVKARCSGTPTLVNSASLKIPGNGDYICESGDVLTFSKDGDGNVVVEITRLRNSPIVKPQYNQRQTVLNGPVDAAGLPNFLPATSASLSITTQNIDTTPLLVTAANGITVDGKVDRIGKASANITFSGLSANSTNYLYVDVNSDGTLTPGSTLLSPVYQFGGSRSVANGQATFNYGSGVMSMAVGNGSAAVQAYRVFIGEVVTNATTVVSTVAYAYHGSYRSTVTSITTNTLYSFAHNIGVNQANSRVLFRQSSSYDWEQLGSFSSSDTGAYRGLHFGVSGKNTGKLQTMATNIYPSTSPATPFASSTATSGEVIFIAERGW